jgi:hypothetical protein
MQPFKYQEAGPASKTADQEQRRRNRRDDLGFLRAGQKKIKLDESRTPDRQRKA